MTLAEIAALAAGIAEQLDKLTPDEASKVMATVAVLRKQASSPLLGAPHFAPPTQRPPGAPWTGMHFHGGTATLAAGGTVCGGSIMPLGAVVNAKSGNA